MSDVLLRTAALFAAFVAMAWFALSIDANWRHVRGQRSVQRRRVTARLRLLGSAALVVSLGLCLAADHPSMAVLVWVMLSAVAALGVAMLLAWYPRLLAYIAR